MKLPLLFFILTQLVIAMLSAHLEKRRARKPTAIDLNSKYYQGKFSVCKPFRPFNPVEAVRAQAFATSIFNRCGPRNIIEFATRYGVPAYAIEKLAKLLCFDATIVYAIIADDGGLRIPANTPYDRIQNYSRIMKSYLLAPGIQYQHKFRGDTYVFSQGGLYDFISNITDCAINPKFPPHPEVDFYKYVIHYFLVMVL
ncbi:uncharacterized protein LOC111243144 [Varroa destructor]|uniref:Uncharacterized protein n=2 Tax=Varroa TaxID=62624 RepID=A0A7M7M333_VARDE|nr:uncharacterized protein LOC111243144 [Varroa destructor]